MGHAARILLRLYPRAWRERYGAEMEALLAERSMRVGDLLDLMRGALDAHLARPVIAAYAIGAQPPILRSAASPPSVQRPPAYGVVPAPTHAALSRRAFLRRVLGAGVGLLSLEFAGGTLAYLWPNITEGLGAEFRVGTLQEIAAAEPRWATGWPYSFAPARAFLVNMPAAMALASGDDVNIPDPSAAEIIALWRKCPHLGCIVPELCEERTRFECRCHGSTYNILGEKLDKGPAERGMDRFAVRIENDGMLIIDTREVIRGTPEGSVTFRDPHPQHEGCA